MIRNPLTLENLFFVFLYKPAGLTLYKFTSIFSLTTVRAALPGSSITEMATLASLDHRAEGLSKDWRTPLHVRLRQAHHLISHPVRFLLIPVMGRADGELGLQSRPAQDLADLGVLRTQGGLP